MHQKTLPLNPLRTFEVAARYESFTEAAIELSVTQAAVSRQISVLEDFFNIKLFERGPRTLELTVEGRRLFNEIAPAFETINWAAHEILRKRDGNIVTIQTYPSLTAMRLTPKLSEFTESSDKISLNLQSAYFRQRFVPENADIYILSCTEPLANMDGFKIGDTTASPAVCPKLFERYGNDPERLLAEQPLLISKQLQSNWTDWAKCANIDIHNSRVMTFDSSFYAYNAAKNGFGVCLAEHFLAVNEIQSNQLVLPFKEALKKDMYYWCLWSTNRHVTPQMQTTLNWLKTFAI